MKLMMRVGWCRWVPDSVLSADCWILSSFDGFVGFRWILATIVVWAQTVKESANFCLGRTDPSPNADRPIKEEQARLSLAGQNCGLRKTSSGVGEEAGGYRYCICPSDDHYYYTEPK